MHLPLLPLEVFRPRWSERADTTPHAVIERGQVVALCELARQAGIRHGMRRGGVIALAPAARLHERDAGRERGALDGVALTLLQYTPEVAMIDAASLVLDVSASLAAFGGRLALCRRVRASVLQMGFSARLGMAPTAQAAWLLANAAGLKRRRSLRHASMVRRLDALPALLLPAARQHADWLDGIGCAMLGELRRLPRAGLQRRCGGELLDQLDRAYGEAPELHEWVEAAPQFACRLDLPERVEQADAVLFAARRLVLQMVGWLNASQLAVSRFVLLLEHERGRQAVAPTALDITLAEAAWREDHLLRLLKERLGRMELSGPVIAIRLEAARLEAVAPPTESLFPEPGGTIADYHRLLELLTARLGADNVLTPAPIPDYRPEIGIRWLPASSSGAKPVRPPDADRPFWLLENPLSLMMRDNRPFYGSPLKILTAPERIETGWWDANCAVRDYFIAQGADQACYWIYRERVGEEVQWFLHGLFA
jgi:protein ImuB